MADILKKLGDKASEYWDKIKPTSLAGEQADASKGIQENMKQAQAVHDMNNSTPTTTPDRTGAGVGGAAKPYGTIGEEKRLDYALKPDAHIYDQGGDVVGGSNMRKLGAPVYDNGGDVAMAGFKKMAPSLDEADPVLKEEEVTPYTGKGRQSNPQPKQQEFNGGSVGGVQDTALATPMYAPGQAPAEQAPAMPSIPVQNAPYDNGGDVKNINDGQHQVAILQTGERVLNRDEAARYRQMNGPKSHSMPVIHEVMDVDTGKPSSSLPELTPAIKPTPTAPLYDEGGDVEEEDDKKRREEQGAPADFGGRVIPNPKDIKPTDSDAPHAPTPMTYPGGAKMNIDNAPLNDEEHDRTFPTVMPTEASAKTARPYAEVEAEQKKAAEAKVNGDRGAQVSGDQQNVQPQAPPEKPEQLPTATHEERVAIKHDEQDAMGKGVQGLAQLGMAKIHAKQLGINEEPSIEGITAPKEFARQDATPKLGGIPKMGEATPEATPAAPAAGAPAAPAAPTATSERSPDFKAKLAQLNQDHANALAERTPEGKVRADYIQEQINDLHKNNPWGTAGNHPGFMGKLGHVASKFGNIAGDVFAPGTMALIPGTDLNKRVQEGGLQRQTQADVQEATAREAEENKATAPGKPLTNNELVFKDLMTGGPNGGPKPNPDNNNQPYTAQEANVASQGTGKTPEELYIQDQMRTPDPTTGKPLSRAQAQEKYLQMKAGVKPLNEQERRVADYLHSRQMEDTPANRESARTAIMKADVESKAASALPFAEQKSTFNNNLSTQKALLVQQNADANQRGIKADELQNTENARSSSVSAKIATARDALTNADEDQFAAQIAPVLSLLAMTSAEGVKRVNKQELDKFVPTSGSFGRWIDAHAEQFLAGKIPADYRNEVGHMLDRMDAAENAEHKINSSSIDNTIRQGAQTPVQKPEGGAKAAPETSKPQTIPTVANNKFHVAGAKGEIVSNDGKTWYTTDGKQVAK